jgi:hypothetical protein
MVYPQVMDAAYGLQILKVAVNILNVQLWTTDNGWPFSLAVVSGVNSYSPKKITLQNITQGLGRLW